MYRSECSPVYINLVNVIEQNLTLNFPKSLEDHMTHLNQFQVQLLRLRLEMISLQASFIRKTCSFEVSEKRCIMGTGMLERHNDLGIIRLDLLQV